MPYESYQDFVRQHNYHAAAVGSVPGTNMRAPFIAFVSHVAADMGLPAVAVPGNARATMENFFGALDQANANLAAQSASGGATAAPVTTTATSTGATSTTTANAAGAQQNANGVIASGGGGSLLPGPGGSPAHWEPVSAPAPPEKKSSVLAWALGLIALMEIGK